MKTEYIRDVLGIDKDEFIEVQEVTFRVIKRRTPKIPETPWELPADV